MDEPPTLPGGLASRVRRTSQGSCAAIVAGLLVVVVALAGCGSSSSPSQSGSGGGARTPTSPRATSTAPATLTTMHVTGYGTVLAAGGKPVYLFSADPPGGSRCAGGCLSEWPPLNPHGQPTAGSGVSASLLSTFKRSDGTTQVAYAKHALYHHNGRGLVSGAGVSSHGGTWYLVSPAGKAIKATTTGGY